MIFPIKTFKYLNVLAYAWLNNIFKCCTSFSKKFKYLSEFKDLNVKVHFLLVINSLFNIKSKVKK